MTSDAKPASSATAAVDTKAGATPVTPPPDAMTRIANAVEELVKVVKNMHATQATALEPAAAPQQAVAPKREG